MKMILLTCHACSKPFERLQKEVNRQIRHGRKYFFCSLSCSSAQTTHSKIKSSCLFCNKQFETTTHKKSNKCCSKNCAVKYAQSFVNLTIHRDAMIQNGISKKMFPMNKKFECVICHDKFEKMVKNNCETYQTCSANCLSKYISQWTRNNPNCGGKLGYRRFKYKNISMDSRWEVEIAKWMDEKGIKWDRSRKRHMFRWIDENGDERKYFPDFYLPDMNIYLDPKNDYYLKRDLSKLKCVINTHGIMLFYGSIENIKNHLTSMLSNVTLL